MKYFSMFSGIGGFEYGIQGVCLKNQEQSSVSSSGNTERQLSEQSDPSAEGFACIGFSEIDKYATQIYKKHFPEHKEYGDVSKINWRIVEDFELLVGGFPCQSFSIAGKRRGFTDTRGTLFFEIVRCLREKQPRLLLLENVKGLLSHDKGKTFFTILTTLDELGYDLQWQVLNSKDFGVPQNRERVFIVGHLRGTSRPKVFPLIKSCKENYEQPLNEALLEYSRRDKDTRIYNKIAPTIQQSFGTGGGNVPYVWKNIQIRKLTPTECERLQGFPDGWTEWGKVDCPWYPEKCITKTTCSNYTFCKGCDPYTGECRINKQIEQKISDTQRYKCLGNAVTTNVIKSIMKRVGG